MVITGPADVGMADRSGVRGAPGRRPPIELGVEDGFDGAVGLGANLDRPLRGRLDARGAVRAGEPHDAEAGAIPLLGMRPGLEDLLAERCGCLADRAGVFPDALNRPAGVAPMARGHVLGNSGVLPVAAGPQVDGDALALVEDLDAASGQAYVNLGAEEAVGDG